jgi:hypothetical protein
MNQRRVEIDDAESAVASLMDIMVIIIIITTISYYFKRKRNPCQHGLVKSNYTVSSLVSYLDYISSLVCSQR